MQRLARYVGPWAMAFGYLSALAPFERDADRYFSGAREADAGTVDDFDSAVRYFGNTADHLLLDLGSVALDAAILITFELAK